MNIPSDRDASGIFRSLSATPGLTESTEKKLLLLANNSEALFSHLNGTDIKNDQVLTLICTIASEWRSLIRENNSELGSGISSDINRLKLFHAFENVLDKVKLVITQKQADTLTQQAEQGEGLLYLLGKGMINAAAVTANLSVEILNVATNYVTPESYQNMIIQKRDEFLEYSTKLLEGDDQITNEHILKGIEEWQKFVNKASYKNDETDIRIVALKNKVHEQLDDSVHEQLDDSVIDDPLSIQTATTQVLSMTQKSEIKEFIQTLENQHEALYDAALEAQTLLPSNIEQSILENGRMLLQNSVANGVDVGIAFTNAIQVTTSASLAYLSEQGEFFQEQSTKAYHQSVESFQKRCQEAIVFLDKKAEQIINNIDIMVEKGDESVQKFKNDAIDQIQQRKLQLVNKLKERAKARLSEPSNIKRKDDYIATTLTPKGLLGDLSSKKLLDDYVWYWVPSFLSKPVDDQVKVAEAHLTTNLQHNFGVILENDNVGRLGVVALKGMENVLVTLNENQDKDSDQILESLLARDKPDVSRTKSSLLPKKPLTLSQYKHSVDKKIAFRIARLAMSEKVGKEVSNGMFAKKWVEFKTQVLGTIIYFVFKNYYNLLPNLLDLMKGVSNGNQPQTGIEEKKGESTFWNRVQKAANNFIGEVTQAATDSITSQIKNYVIDELKLGPILEQLDGQSDIAFYYIMDKITAEMEDIVVSSNDQKPIQSVKTQNEEIEEVSSLKQAVEDFTSPNNSILNEGLKTQLAPFMALLKEQGNAQSVLDVTSPIVELLPQWRNWINPNLNPVE